ncbi:MAG TPA: alpha/beta fold hydrolase [Candidatus Sulfotelmatobacter sp.]|nr:alpha/beta fold hydrolase [Candidatus Sulfotelmatobacter sp.]
MYLEVDGKRVYAATGGRDFDATLPAVVFLHGAAMDHTAWVLQTRWFAYHGRAVLALDLPGHGRSDGPLPASVQAAADWLPRLLDAAGVAQAALVGHSMGGLIALEAAARHPDRVWALGLVGVAVPMAVNDEFLSLARANDHKAVALMMDWSHARKSQIGGHRMPGLWLMGSDERLVEQAHAGVLHHGLSLCNAYAAADGHAAAAKVRCPVLLLQGERDLMTPLKSARALAAKFTAADVVTLPDCGHMTMGERPDETLDALRELV